jgi:hypothetical protein
MSSPRGRCQHRAVTAADVSTAPPWLAVAPSALAWHGMAWHGWLAHGGWLAAWGRAWHGWRGKPPLEGERRGAARLAGWLAGW